MSILKSLLTCLKHSLQNPSEATLDLPEEVEDAGKQAQLLPLTQWSPSELEWMLLMLLRRQVSLEDDDPAILSQSDWQIVEKAIARLVETLLVPHLDAILKSPKSNSNAGSYQMLYIASVSLTYIAQSQVLAKVLYKKHLVTLLSAVILLACCCANQPNVVFPDNVGAFFAALSQYDNPRQFLKIQLTKILSQDLTLSEAVLNISLVIVKHKDSWQFFAKACRNIQTKLLLRPGGLEAYLNLMPLKSGGIDLEKVALVCETLCRTQPPQQMSAGDFRAELEQQTLQLLCAKHPASIMMTKSLLAIHPEFQDTLIRPLALCSQPSGTEPLPSDTELCQTIEILHKLVVESQDVISDLEPVFCLIPVLFAIYVPTYKGIFYLRSQVESLLKKLLTAMATQSEAGAALVRSLCQPNVWMDWTSMATLVPRRSLREEDSQHATFAMEHLLTNVLPSLILAFLIYLLQELEKADGIVPELAVLLEPLCESLHSHLASHSTTDLNPDLDLLHSVLKRGLDPLTTNSDILPSFLAGLSQAATILLLTAKKKGNQDWKALSAFLPTLQQLADKLSDSKELSQLFQEIQIAIATHGAAGDLPRERSERTRKSPYQTTLDKLMDPLLPVRSSGLKDLRDLVVRLDNETITNHEVVFSIFMEGLKEEDSYLYLPSVLGLAALVTTAALRAELLPRLAREYQLSFQASPELRERLGEVFLKVCENLGEMTAQYRDILLPTFLHMAAKDPNLKPSALSSLASVCRFLKFSLGPYLWEIVSCVASFLKTPSQDVQVRRAAALVLTEILRGIGGQAFQLHPELPREVQRIIRRALETDPDDVVRLHCQLCQDELTALVRTSLEPPSKLEYHIRVLDPE